MDSHPFRLFVLQRPDGVAFGAVLHNTAAAIVLSFVLPTAFGLLGFTLKSVAQWIDTATTFD